MMKTQVEEVVDELDEALGEVDPMVTIVEEDEILLFWNNRQVRCKQRLVACFCKCVDFYLCFW